MQYIALLHMIMLLTLMYTILTTLTAAAGAEFWNSIFWNITSLPFSPFLLKKYLDSKKKKLQWKVSKLKTINVFLGFLTIFINLMNSFNWFLTYDVSIFAWSKYVIFVYIWFCLVFQQLTTGNMWQLQSWNRNRVAHTIKL